MNNWKKEHNERIATAILGRQVRRIYGANLLQIEQLLDVTDPENVHELPDFSVDLEATVAAARIARHKGLIRAWSLAEGPQGHSAMAMRFDGQCTRGLAPDPAHALAIVLNDVASHGVLN